MNSFIILKQLLKIQQIPKILVQTISRFARSGDYLPFLNSFYEPAHLFSLFILFIMAVIFKVFIIAIRCMNAPS